MTRSRDGTTIANRNERYDEDLKTVGLHSRRARHHDHSVLTRSEARHSRSRCCRRPLHALDEHTLAHAQTFTFDTDEQLQVLTPSEEKHDLQLGRKVTVRPDGSRFCLLRPTYLGSPWWPYRI